MPNLRLPLRRGTHMQIEVPKEVTSKRGLGFRLKRSILTPVYTDLYQV